MTEENTGTVDGAGRSLDTGTTKVIEALPASSGCWTVGSVASSDWDILPAAAFLLLLGLGITFSSSGAAKKSVNPK